uniref:Carboxylic ester hydrolase n=1 Tax=Clastoptera arizonana TaxID=38151 RepID=A0A1B6BZN9_9HEMI
MCNIQSFLSTLLCLLTFKMYFSNGQILVNTSSGLVTGSIKVSKFNNATYKEFINIPYALPPTGQLRFKAPQKFTGRNNKEPINKETGEVFCPQLMKNKVAGSEDCLVLNVYTPLKQNATGSLYAVMIWIHGGGLIEGYGQVFQPDFFMLNQEIIIVTINYRLGALGFLSLGNEDAPGNAGLKDQALAMAWVKDEIQNFGGNPKKVTLAGESAGSISAFLHILNSYSKGLFHRAILESGTAYDLFFLKSGFVERATVFAELIECTENNKVNFGCLQNASLLNIINYQELPLPFENEIQEDFLSFSIVKESPLPGAFQTDTIDYLLKNMGNPVPTIMGTNKDEGLIFIRKSNMYFHNIFNNLRYFIPKNIRDKLPQNEIKKRTEQIKTYYFPSKLYPSLDHFQEFVKMYTDKVYNYGMVKTAQLLISGSNYQPVYMYKFLYEGSYKLTILDSYELKKPGVAHGDETGYLFLNSWANQSNSDIEAYNVSRKIVELWTSFVQTGLPIPQTMSLTSVLYNASWDPITCSSTNYLGISTNLTMKYEQFLNDSAIELWDAVAAPLSGTFTLKSTIIPAIICCILVLLNVYL